MRTRTGCQPCRDRHIKCVKQPEATKCDKCVENQRDCIEKSALHRWRPVRSVVLKNPRNGQPTRQSLTHDASQVWVNVPTVNFEVKQFDAASSEEGDLENSDPKHSSSYHGEPGPASKRARLEQHHTGSVRSEEWDTSLTYATMPSQGSYHSDIPSKQHFSILQHDTSPVSMQRTPKTDPGPAQHCTMVVSPSGYYTSPSHHSVRSDHRSTNSMHSPLTSLSMSWPFRSSREADLCHHYIKNISPWIDVLDPQRHFGRDIPRRAAQHPVISYGIFAMASRHLSILSGEEKDNESPRYLHECLNMVINILEDPLGHSDENLLAAVILLRSHEEMSDIDERCHLLGTARILNSIASYAADGGFKESASWISLRQDIYVSLTSQQPLSLNLSNYRHSGVFSGQSDESWANRIVYTFASILNYVFGGEYGLNSWSDLEAEAEAWNLTKPWYFSALWSKESADESQPWPKLQTSDPAHAVGLQYYCLCKIVLAIYDPRLTKLGFASHKLRKASEATVVDNLRMAVGLAVNNPDVSNAMFQGSHILTVCGSYLHDPTDQEAAVDFLIGMQKKMGWRTTQIIQDLRDQWDG